LYLDGDVFDWGGMWVGPSQKHILQLADELGVEKHLQYDKGQSIFQYQEKIFRYSFLVPVIGISIVEVRLDRKSMSLFLRSLCIVSCR